MASGPMLDILLLATEALLVCALVLGLAHLRRSLGLAPLYVALGAFQLAQALLAASIYVEIGGGLLVSPGSAVLFPVTLFAVLVVYLREDALEARKLVYGLIAANLTLAALLFVTNWQLARPTTRNLIGLPADLFRVGPLSLVSGTLILWVDAILLIVLFEALGRWWRRGAFLRTFLSLAGVLAVDTVLFVTVVFAGSDAYFGLLVSGILGKTLTSLVFAATLATYMSAARQRRVRGPHEIRDVFQALSYRDRFEKLQQSANRDDLTGAYSRRFLEKVLAAEVSRAVTEHHPLGVLMVDIDRFKRVNDNHGHPEGDRVLQLVASALRDSVRSADAVCRYGGEEFCVVLPSADPYAAHALAERLRQRVHGATETAEPPLPGGAMTVTVGVATCPDDGITAVALVEAADRRLYAGKRAGRDRTVSVLGRVA